MRRWRAASGTCCEWIIGRLLCCAFSVVVNDAILARVSEIRTRVMEVRWIIAVCMAIDEIVFR